MTMEPLSVGHHDEPDEDGENLKEDLRINDLIFPSPWYVAHINKEIFKSNQI